MWVHLENDFLNSVMWRVKHEKNSNWPTRLAST